MTILPGLTAAFKTIVQTTDTAAAVGSDLPAVLSTPRLVSLLETTAHQALLPYFTAGQSSVGSRIAIDHLAATPVGMQIHIQVEVLAVDGRQVFFKVEAWDETEKIVTGEHTRFIIDVQRFNDKLKKKFSARP